MEDFIPLDRRFSDYNPNQDEETDAASVFWGGDFYAPYRWDDILSNAATIVIAEGGTGKSIEFKEKTKALIEAGKAAFYCPLENLEHLAFDAALERGNADQLNSWLQSTAEGWFFLDAADEAKLRSPRQLQRAIVKFVRVIEDHKQRSHIFISTRPHAWGDTEIALLCSLLQLRLPNEKDPADDETTDENDDPLRENGNAEAQAETANPKTPKSQLKHLQLAPLDQIQIRTFARLKGVVELDDFMDALERTNADIFANRPSDLPGLIDIWIKTGRIGSYSEVVLKNIQLKLKEINSTYTSAGVLTAEKALLGAERLAAAATFTRKSSLLLSGYVDLNAKVRDNALDPQDVLLDWRPAEVQELLGRALFDASLYGTVRFHHRIVRVYLATRWLCRLLKQRKHRRSIKQLIVKRPYNTLPPVVVPSLKPVAAWLALWDQGLRDDILRIDPKVLLEFGDASALPTEVKAKLLRDYAERYANQNYTLLSLNTREIRRLADTRLAETVRNLLAEYRAHEDVRQTLLRLVREGRIPGFGGTALAFARDASTDDLTRTYAIEVIGVTGTNEEKVALKELLLTAPQQLQHQILAAGIKVLFPGHMNVSELDALLEAARPPRAYSYDTLQYELEQLSDSIAPQLRSDLLAMMQGLLQRRPYVNDWCPVSSQYSWLLAPAMLLVSGLISDRPEGPYSDVELSVIDMAIASDRASIYTGKAPSRAKELITEQTDLRHALFWYKIAAQRRADPDRRLTDIWQLRRFEEIRQFSTDDSTKLLAAMREKPLLDDRLVAQSALLTLHRWYGDQQVLDQVRAISADTTELQAALDNYLQPQPSSPEQVERDRRYQAEEARRARENEQRQADHLAWIQRVRDNPSTVGTLERASEAVIVNNTVWLFEELRDRSGNNSRLTQARWTALIPDFGQEVATTFRDFCIAFWRHYTPSVQSDAGPRGNSTPWAVILGLSGIAMEAAGNPNWATNLTPAEAALATRYALWEINGTPSWLTQVRRTHQESVDAVLVREITWELSRTASTSESRSAYVLYRLRWGASELGLDLRSVIISLLMDIDTQDPEALSQALTVVLRDRDPVPPSFIAHVIERAENVTNDALKSWWLAALLCLDAENGMSRLDSWVVGSANPAQGEERISTVLSHIWGDRFRNLNPAHQTFLSAPILLRLLKLSHTYIRLEDDLEHDGMYSPGLRDHAQDARNQLLKLLCDIPGQPTYEALLELSLFHPQQYPRERMLVLAERRAEADCEALPWEPQAVSEFAASAEQEPRTQYDLHQLAMNRLDDLKLDLEEGDESEATVLQRINEEPELRRVLANRLRQASVAKYTTGSEEELADQTRTDIRLHNPPVDARIPIELKIADKWTAASLRERLENQLVGQYLRDARYGVFLLVRRGNLDKKDRQGWVLNGPGPRRRFTFDDLVRWLQSEAQQILEANPSVDGLNVIGIDLLRRRQSPNT